MSMFPPLVVDMDIATPVVRFLRERGVDGDADRAV